MILSGEECFTVWPLTNVILGGVSVVAKHIFGSVSRFYARCMHYIIQYIFFEFTTCENKIGVSILMINNNLGPTKKLPPWIDVNWLLYYSCSFFSDKLSFYHCSLDLGALVYSVLTVIQLPQRYGDVIMRGNQSVMHVVSTTNCTRYVVLSVVLRLLAYHMTMMS